MSAIAENPDEPVEVIQVLFALHPKFGAQELCGPLEVLTRALQKNNDPGKPPPFPALYKPITTNDKETVYLT